MHVQVIAVCRNTKETCRARGGVNVDYLQNIVDINARYFAPYLRFAPPPLPTSRRVRLYFDFAIHYKDKGNKILKNVLVIQE